MPCSVAIWMAQFPVCDCVVVPGGVCVCLRAYKTSVSDNIRGVFADGREICSFC